MKLNLTPQNKQEELILNYLQNNASETLADKINNGTPFEKTVSLCSTKDAFGLYEIRLRRGEKSCRKGANSACIDDATVYGWAIHFLKKIQSKARFTP